MNGYNGIGVFDSGVGGLTVASEIAETLPSEKIVYFGDTAHVPYGDKTESQIFGYVHNIIEFLKKKNVKAIVMACNTSSALVLPHLNGKIGVPVLGVIEFASRMALEASPRERIGIVANPVTVRSGAYLKKIKGISMNGVYVEQVACPMWVPMVEAGRTSGPDVEEIVRKDLKHIIDADVDTLILGCTHYPYLAPIIEKVMGNNVRIINPAKALALRLKDILEENDTLSDFENPTHEFYVSGNPDEFVKMGSRFFGSEIREVLKAEIDENLVNA